MATTTVTELVTRTIYTALASATNTVRATPQGGILEGANPSSYDPKNPIIMFIIQVSFESSRGTVFSLTALGRHHHHLLPPTSLAAF